MVTVYHASNNLFTKFEIPHNGLHFGSIESAKEAVSRKSGKKYLYKVKLDGQIEDVFDCGFNWSEELNSCEKKIYSYTNKYEPSIHKSYVIFSDKYIKQMNFIGELNE